MLSPRTRALLYVVCLTLGASPLAAQRRRARTPKPPAPEKPFPAAVRTAIEDALGRPGTQLPGAVLKFGFPRGDLRVVANGVTLRAPFALGSWIGFQRVGDHAMVMGDLVLLESEVESVMASLQQNGVEQTALHNHLQGELPRVMYMHIHAIGNPARIARAIRTAIEFTGTPLQAPTLTRPGAAPVGAQAPPPPRGTGKGGVPIPTDLDTAAIAAALGVHGTVNGGVYQLSVPRREKIRDDKLEIQPSMGISTAINFQPTGAGKAAITGDFVLLGREVNPVLWSLEQSGIQVTAIHSHMLGEDPRLYFMHFWANDDALKLARGLRAALGQLSIDR
jgi:hypothetical protein